MALRTQDDQLVMLCFGDNTPPSQCIFFKSGPNDGSDGVQRVPVFQNMSTEELAMSIREEVDHLRRLLFITTEVLSVAILLLFILILVLVWRVNSVVRKKSRRRKVVTTLTGQTYSNPAFISDVPATMLQHVLKGEKPPEYASQ